MREKEREREREKEREGEKEGDREKREKPCPHWTFFGGSFTETMVKWNSVK